MNLSVSINKRFTQRPKVIKSKKLCRQCQYQYKFTNFATTIFETCPFDFLPERTLEQAGLPLSCPYEFEAFMYREGRLCVRVWNKIKRFFRCFVRKYVNDASTKTEAEGGTGQG